EEAMAAPFALAGSDSTVGLSAGVAVFPNDVITEETVKTHVSRFLSKLGVCDRTQAVVAAHESGLVATTTGAETSPLNSAAIAPNSVTANTRMGRPVAKPSSPGVGSRCSAGNCPALERMVSSRGAARVHLGAGGHVTPQQLSKLSLSFDFCYGAFWNHQEVRC